MYNILSIGKASMFVMPLLMCETKTETETIPISISKLELDIRHKS